MWLGLRHPATWIWTRILWQHNPKYFTASDFKIEFGTVLWKPVFLHQSSCLKLQSHWKPWDILPGQFHHKCLKDSLLYPYRTKLFPKCLSCYLCNAVSLNSSNDTFPEYSLRWQNKMNRPLFVSWHFDSSRKSTLGHAPLITDGRWEWIQTDGYFLTGCATNWRCWVPGPQLKLLNCATHRKVKDDPPFKRSEWAQCSVLVLALPGREAEMWNTTYAHLYLY